MQFGAEIGQMVPHAPQLFGSPAMNTSQPSAVMPSQFAYPGLQGPAVHVLAVHCAAVVFGN